MTKIHKKQNSHNSDHAFCNFLKQEAQSEEYRQLKQATESHTHPTGEMLYDYVTGGLNDEEAMIIRRHIAYCSVCSNEVLNIMRIENELEKPVKPSKTIQKIKQIPGMISQFCSSLLNPEKYMAMVTACFVLFIAFFGLNEFLSQPPTFVSFQFIANPGKVQTITKGEISVSGEFELKQGGTLNSLDYFNIKFDLDSDSYIYIIFHDSSGQIAKSSYGKKAGGKIHTLSHTDKGYPLQLDTIPGTEAVYLLASEKTIPDFEKKAEELKKTGIKQINRIFPKTTIQSFSFKHE